MTEPPLQYDFHVRTFLGVAENEGVISRRWRRSVSRRVLFVDETVHIIGRAWMKIIDKGMLTEGEGSVRLAIVEFKDPGFAPQPGQFFLTWYIQILLFFILIDQPWFKAWLNEMEWKERSF